MAGNTNNPVKEPYHTTCEPALKDWLICSDDARISSSGEVCFTKIHSNDVGSETGLMSVDAYNDVELAFDFFLHGAAWFIFKIHQLDAIDQTTNSYHIVSEPTMAYLAKHDTVLGRLPVARGRWQRVMMRWVDQVLEVFLDSRSAIRLHDNQLQSGYCFIGLKGGRVEVKNITLSHVLTNSTAEPSQIANVQIPPTRMARILCGHRGGGYPEPGTGLWPFSTTPRRNLIYHVWPVRGSHWAWNLDQLKNRLDLFNGRRILGIVHDHRSEPPERIQEYLEGHGFEFIVNKNDERGEAISFPLLLGRIVSDDPNEVTFYGHAKGVKYTPNVPLPVRRWSEVQYRVSLDDWLTVRTQLERFAMTGPFKMLGRFRAHRLFADWHYSGTYFWMRNAHIFARNYLDVPQFYGGVETWPGTLFRKEETACLFMDNLRELPYHEQFWRQTAQAAFVKWEAALGCISPPPDLAHPTSYKGYSGLRMEQKPDEFEWWIDWLLKSRASSLLTIGAGAGGAEWHTAREFREHGRYVEITSIEYNPGPQLGEIFSDAERRFGQSLKLVAADSTAEATRAQLASRYDAVFIDGDHSYRACRSDFVLAKSLKPRLIGLHDIVDSDWHASARCSVSRLWAELSREYRTEEKAAGDWGGVGVVILEG